jgi:hypothetical protein
MVKFMSNQGTELTTLIWVTKQQIETRSWYGMCDNMAAINVE